MLATVNGWSSAEKATYFTVSLRDPALTVLTNISPEHHAEYDILLTALDKRFGRSHWAELNQVKLKGRICKREETLAELAEKVARLAYHDSAPE